MRPFLKNSLKRFFGYGAPRPTELLETTFPLISAIVSDVVRMRFGCGSGVVRMWFRRGSEVARRWLGRVFGSGADSLAEVKGKWFPAH